MEKLKFTPGPWEVVQKNGSLPERSAWLVGRRGCTERDETLICEMPFFATRGDLKREFEANARLIAAAPDMYEALDATAVDLDYLRRAIEAGDPKPELLIRIKDIQDRNAAALSKAEGGEGQG